MAREWADSTDKVGTIRVKCARLNNNEDETGCGWGGRIAVVESYGANEWEVDFCPDCNGPLEEAS